MDQLKKYLLATGCLVILAGVLALSSETRAQGPPQFIPASPCGVSPVRQRFVVSQDGTEVCDNTTGLRWEQTPDPTLDISQPAALTHCPTVGMNYRLPEIRELHSLIDYAEGNQATALNTPNGPFTNVQSAAYWSATSWVVADSTKWAVDFGFSRSGQVFTDFGGGGNAVWCVR